MATATTKTFSGKELEDPEKHVKRFNQLIPTRHLSDHG